MIATPMYHRTPFRQLRQIYSSLLALGRLPGIAEEINRTIASNGVEQMAAIRSLATSPPATETVKPPVAAPVLASHKHRLSAFRSELLAKIEQPLLCVDIGARWGVDSALLALKGKAKLLCFDPDEEECARLQANHSVDELEYVPLALSSDGRELSLTITREPACSSIYDPDEKLYTNYPALAESAPDRVVCVPSSSLDNFLAARNLGKPHLFKIDTQGSELDILKGSVRNLSEVCMIDVEVEFNPLYKGQPLFGQVDSFMRTNGFVLWRLTHLVHYPVESFDAASTEIEAVAHPPSRIQRINPGNGQLFWGQAHYVRSSFLVADPTPIDAAFARRAAVVTSAYGYWDLSLTILEKCPETKVEASDLRAILRA